MSEKFKILLVEDDPNMGELVKDALIDNDFDVTLCLDGKEGLSTFIKGSFNICILDVMMPHMDGFTLAQRIKKLSPETPFMFLTAKNDMEDKMEGYEIGADDYLTKPFSVKELVMRINVISRRLQGNLATTAENSQFELGKLFFDYAKRELGVKNNMQKISSKEAELLKLFCVNPNKIVRREFLLKNVWGDDDYFSSKSMDVYISRLRKLLKSEPEVQIINIHGTGYRFLIPGSDAPFD
ncbi:MAG: response regulator transcription factor [Bacteroidetes bacterium]|nr:response regulator transcription factor [Bacteroidota bacterium]